MVSFKDFCRSCKLLQQLKDQPIPPEDHHVDVVDQGADAAIGTGLNFDAYIQRDGKCYHIQAVQDGGLLFKPYGRKIASGDGLFLKKGQNIYHGEGLLLGPNSPYISNTILGWLL